MESAPPSPSSWRSEGTLVWIWCILLQAALLYLVETVPLESGWPQLCSVLPAGVSGDVRQGK